MITFLSSAKPFVGINKINQQRAIKSWLAISPDVEVIIYGESEGAEAISKELGFTYIPKITCFSSGLPYFNEIVSHAAEYARHDIQVYLNCDILIPYFILYAIRRLPFPKYLLVGQRIDLADGVSIDVTSQQWIEQLKHLTSKGKAELHYPGGMDYFVFPRGLWQSIKPIAIGRASYDNALIAYCIRNRIPIIDGTLAIPALHQYHEYNHVDGGVHEIYYGKDAEQNKVMHRVGRSAPNTADADFILDKDILVRNHRQDSLRRLEIYLRYRLNLGPTWMAIRALWRLLDAAGLHRPDDIDLNKVLDSYPMILKDNPYV